MAACGPVVAGDEENGELDVKPSGPTPAVHVEVRFAEADPWINPDIEGTISKYRGLEIPLVNIWDTELFAVTPFV